MCRGKLFWIFPTLLYVRREHFAAERAIPLFQHGFTRSFCSECNDPLLVRLKAHLKESYCNVTMEITFHSGVDDGKMTHLLFVAPDFFAVTIEPPMIF